MTSIGVQAGAISMNESVAKSTETVNYSLDTSSHLEENSLFYFQKKKLVNIIVIWQLLLSHAFQLNSKLKRELTA